MFTKYGEKCIPSAEEVIVRKDASERLECESYKDRFKEEYHQTKARYEKLKAFNTRVEAGKIANATENKVLVPKLNCPAGLLREQQSIMGQYLHILEVRAAIEGIEL